MAKNLLKNYFNAVIKNSITKKIVQKQKKLQEEVKTIQQVKPTSFSKAIILLYESLYQQISLKSHYRFFPTKLDKLQICKFIRWVRVNKRTANNVDFLIAYFEFQFSHYYGVQTKYGKNQIMFNWIIGQKAIQRYEQRDISKRWLVRLKNKNIKLNLKKVVNQFNKPKIKYENKLYNFEENEKKRYYNDPKGLFYCLITTTLYNPMSNLCLNCNNKEECKTLLKTEFPNTFKLRRC